jgi:omega-amidase
VRVALVQCSVDPAGPEVNRARAFTLLDAAPGADLYLLPELWSTGYYHDQWQDAAARSTPAIVDALSAWAIERNATVGGSLISLRDDGTLANRYWWLGSDGTRRWYDKVHLFAPLREVELLSAGDKPGRQRVHDWEVGQSTCYDLRFPEQYRRDALAGAGLFAVVSAWPDPRSEALRTLARARAIENQAWLALCNRPGPGEQGSMYCGGSMIVAPDGEIVCDAGRDEGVTVGVIDRTRFDAIRAANPTLCRRVEGIDW